MILPLKRFLMPPSSKAQTTGMINLDTSTGTILNTIQMATMMISRVGEGRKRKSHQRTNLI
jgi:hypothetical protein